MNTTEITNLQHIADIIILPILFRVATLQHANSGKIQEEYKGNAKSLLQHIADIIILSISFRVANLQHAIQEEYKGNANSLLQHIADIIILSISFLVATSQHANSGKSRLPARSTNFTLRILTT